MASALHWIPDTLYNYSISAVVTNYTAYRAELRAYHGDVLFDVYYKLYKEGRLLQLGNEFQRIETFEKVLKVKDKRVLLHNCFQALMDHGYCTASKLASEYKQRCLSANEFSCDLKDKIIQLGFSLGSFLIDAGWFPESENILTTCLELCSSYSSPYILPIVLECHIRLLRVRNIFCKFQEAEATFQEAKSCIEKIKCVPLKVNFASIYGEFSALFFGQSNYKEAYRWTVKALDELNSCLYPREIINVLRQASKACVVKREFKRAGMLIKQALHLARERFGNRNLVVADTMVDYGFYLLNADSISHSIKVYQTALDLRTSVFGGRNLLVAMAHEDLAYGSYVYEYSSGRFNDAKDHADKALTILHSLLNEDHFLLSSAKRVKALILEEIAIDSHDKETKERLFFEAQDLHLHALRLSQKCFGEMNVQTAKHYGNLGRLYQSMRRFKEAQTMHLKAISIKESILGPDDYEVALSIGHLASLYNYDMELYKEAEVLYLRSIRIGLNLFGKSYSGLEYDYRGLLRVYATLGNASKVAKLHSVLHSWKLLRDQTAEAENETSPLNLQLEPIAPENMLSHFTSVQ